MPYSLIFVDDKGEVTVRDKKWAYYEFYCTKTDKPVVNAGGKDTDTYVVHSCRPIFISIGSLYPVIIDHFFAFSGDMESARPYLLGLNAIAMYTSDIRSKRDKAKLTILNDRESKQDALTLIHSRRNPTYVDIAVDSADRARKRVERNIRIACHLLLEGNSKESSA